MDKKFIKGVDQVFKKDYFGGYMKKAKKREPKRQKLH